MGGIPLFNGSDANALGVRARAGVRMRVAPETSTVLAVTNAGLRRLTIWVETTDGDVEEVERESALVSPVVMRRAAMGEGKREAPVQLPKQVSLGALRLILEYCRFHRAPGRSDKERKIFDEKFIRMDTRCLCELTSAADSLELKFLVDLASHALARMIEGKTPEEIRETFHLPDDLTEEEKLEPVKNTTYDPRIKALNTLYARKRKMLKERKAIEVGYCSLSAGPASAHICRAWTTSSRITQAIKAADSDRASLRRFGMPAQSGPGKAQKGAV
eukprot:TRINITY_DN2665_c0_g1_i2.p1 TRINITY_DN2665_c0_g1~~TRINITY_DN2665_c0_g1_i2.p1  ORF type:complete len:285 (-),score=54.14 TRINITY_DN2665_c0_g1_i2:255-1076(-)